MTRADVGADLAGRRRRRAAGRARSPTASTCRRGSSAEMARLFDEYLGAGLAAIGTTTRRCGTRVLDDSRRGAVGACGRRCAAICSPSSASAPAQRWTEEHVGTPRVVAAGTLLDPDALTIGFARRFTGYKRPGADLPRPRAARAASSTRRGRPVQIIFAGKAHPADDIGKHHLQQRLPARARSDVRRPHRVRRRLRSARRALPRAGLRRLAEQPAQAARGERHERDEGGASTACRI